MGNNIDTQTNYTKEALDKLNAIKKEFHNKLEKNLSTEEFQEELKKFNIQYRKLVCEQILNDKNLDLENSLEKLLEEGYIQKEYNSKGELLELLELAKQGKIYLTDKGRSEFFEKLYGKKYNSNK